MDAEKVTPENLPSPLMNEAQWNRFYILLGLRLLLSFFLIAFVVDLLFDWLRFFFANSASPTLDLWNRLLQAVRSMLTWGLIIGFWIAFDLWQAKKRESAK